MSDKPAITGFPIHELLRDRWSPRAFSQQPIERNKLGSLFEAARWAASCFGEQPWSYLAGVAGDATHEKLASCLMPINAAWAAKAPVLVLSVACLKFTHNGNPNRHAYHDVGAAAAQLTLQAMSAGLYLHQMGGFDQAKSRQLFEIPDGHDPVAMIALGYPGDPAALGEDLYKKELAPRSRKPLSQIVFSGKWGDPSELLK